jgi:hypothetical protein
MNVNQIDRRVIEAQLLRQVRDQLLQDMDQRAANDVVRRSVEASAREAGREFARSAPQGPNLAHFATVIKRWQAGGALDIADVELQEHEFSFTVIRCGYVAAYDQLGLDRDFAWLVSCSRDAAFAQGYSPCLHLSRSRTIAQDAPACRFAFHWDASCAAQQPEDDNSP